MAAAGRGGAVGVGVTDDRSARNYGQLIHDTRCGLDEQYRPQPPVERHEAGADRLQWTLALREGLKFRDNRLDPGQKQPRHPPRTVHPPPGTDAAAGETFRRDRFRLMLCRIVQSPITSRDPETGLRGFGWRDTWPIDWFSSFSC